MIELLDRRGHPVHAGNKDAATATVTGIDRYCHWRADAVGHLDQAIDGDPAAAMARLAKGWVLHLARSAAYAGVISTLMEDAEATMVPEDTRARAYLEALRAAVAGQSIRAAARLREYLLEAPTDLFAHRLVQFELFWNGRARSMLSVVETAQSAWSPDLPGYGDFLACRAFANEESGNYSLAESCGRRSVEVAATDAWGAHAVAHVLVMQGRTDDGLKWLESLSPEWAGANQIRHHLWWHLALFALERGEHERILALLVEEIRNPESPLIQAMPDATIDIQNVASMLLRLEMRGVDVGDRWNVLAEVCAGRVHNHAHAFSNAHDMMVLAATGQFDLAHTLLDSMREFVANTSSTLASAYRLAGIPVCEALLAHRQGRYDDVIAHLGPAQHDLPLIGGSHAQRDVFAQVLFDAARRTGRVSLARVVRSDAEGMGFENLGARTLYREVA